MGRKSKKQKIKKTKTVTIDDDVSGVPLNLLFKFNIFKERIGAAKPNGGAHNQEKTEIQIRDEPRYFNQIPNGNTNKDHTNDTNDQVSSTPKHAKIKSNTGFYFGLMYIYLKKEWEKENNKETHDYSERMKKYLDKIFLILNEINDKLIKDHFSKNKLFIYTLKKIDTSITLTNEKKNQLINFLKNTSEIDKFLNELKDETKLLNKITSEYAITHTKTQWTIFTVPDDNTLPETIDEITKLKKTVFSISNGIFQNTETEEEDLDANKKLRKFLNMISKELNFQ